MEVTPRKEPEEEPREQVPLLILRQTKEGQVIPPRLVPERVPQGLEEQELMEVSPRKEPEEEPKEQVPLLIPPQKKEAPVIPPQLALERVPEELGEQQASPRKELEEELKEQVPRSPHFQMVMTKFLSERRTPQCQVNWEKALEVLQKAQVQLKLVRS
jgi:hypothetical protein